MRRFAALLLVLAIAAIIFGSTTAGARRYGCHDLSAWITEVHALDRSVCYPCPPSAMLPISTPSVRAVWDSEVCPLP
jgi:hypothetical protein